MQLRSMLRTSGYAFVVSLGMSAAANAATYYVDGRVSSSGAGTSWPTAKKTIQEAVAIQSLAAGDYIYVAGRVPDQNNPGLVYKPTGTTTGFIQLASGVRIWGGLRGNDGSMNDPNDRDPATFVTILSGDMNNNDIPGDFSQNRTDNAIHVVTSPSTCLPPSPGLGADGANLDGFTIRGGQYSGDGGGIWIAGGANSIPVIRDCLITDNYSGFAGGGVWVDGNSASPVFRKCRFVANEAYLGGGAIYAGFATVTCLDCTFDSNVTEGLGGGYYGWRSLAFHALSCTFKNNISGSASASINGLGGAVYSGGGSQTPVLVLTNCRFFDNAAVNSGQGGAIAIDDRVTATITNCTIVENSATTGGGIYINNPTGGVTTVTNCILWDDTASTGPEISVASGSLTVTYSNVEGGWSGTGNINAAPTFDSDYRLVCNSRGINEGSNSATVVDAQDADEDGNTSEKIDLEFAPRIVYAVDMGAYETAAPPCLADTNNDCVVNVNDLLAVINQWGTCSICTADVDPPPCGGNGVVNVNDLLAVINAWGTCDCFTGEPYQLGSLQSVTDCMDHCSEFYQPYSQSWNECVNGCVEGLCRSGILPPEDCQ